MDQEARSLDEVVGANGAVTQKRIVALDGRKMTRVKSALETEKHGIYESALETHSQRCH